jgi:predicted dehydrogenase
MQRFRVVILGTGFGRTVQAAAFQRSPGFELVGIAGSDPDKTRRIAGELGIPESSGDWRELLARLKPDLVSIATPPFLHHPMMLEALAGGAHVLCEKPTALHRFQAAEMRDRAAAGGKVAAMNHEFRFQSARRAALTRVRAGDIGEPRRGEILGRYSLWTRPESRGMTWLADHTRGGGILGALGSHHTDALRLFFGEPLTALATVRIDQPWRGESRATADDGCTVQYEFAGGATGLIDLSATAPYRWERFEIHGAEASLRWDESGEHLWRIVVGKEPEELEIPAPFRLARQAGDPALVAPFGVLLGRLERALRGGEPMQPNFDDAVAVQSALDAARASSAAGTRVGIEVPSPALPITARTFVP